MENDTNKVSHWFKLKQENTIQGLVATAGDEQRVYVATVDADN